MAAKTLAELRAARGNFETMSQQIADLNKKGSFEKVEDERMWQCKLDDAKNGSAVIRFLTAPKGEENAVVRMFYHSFKDPTTKQWYIENSRTMLPEGTDFILEENDRLWKTEIKANQDIVRPRSRKKAYYANVLIISDPAAPENEGKVKIFRFNETIFTKIQDQLKPEFDDEKAVNVFDFWEGANFRLRIVQKEGFANFDKSKFDEPSAISKSDDAIDAIWDQCHPLAELVSADKIKSYEVLKARAIRVLGLTDTSDKGSTELTDDDKAFLQKNSDTPSEKAAPKKETAKKESPKKTEKPVEKAPTIDPDDNPATGASDGEDEDSDLAYFAKLAEG